MIEAVGTVTTPLLLKLVQTGQLRPAGLVTHRFGLDDIMQAYDTFADAAKTSALEVLLKGRGPNSPHLQVSLPRGDYARHYP